MSTHHHIPVLLNESLSFLKVESGDRVIDATFGGGGHSRALLEKGVNVFAIDCDEEAIERGKEVLSFAKKYSSSFQIAKGNFRSLHTLASENGVKSVQGILFDLGVSSFQIDAPYRGFSFQKEGPLDMRMDQQLGVTALDLLAVLSRKQLYELLYTLGEEKFAFAISNSIVRAREVNPIRTTEDLVRIIAQCYGLSFGSLTNEKRFDISKRVFQALRIAVNDELGSISMGLSCSLELLANKGRIVVISFHSLEDRIVKDTFREFEQKKLGKVITKKPIVPTDSEMGQNSRSRSAKLRVFEKN